MQVRKIISTPALLAGFCLALATGGFAQSVPAPAPAAAVRPAPPPLSPIIWTEDPSVVQRFAVDDARVREMVNNAVLKLTSASDLGTAWTRLGVTPQDIVGIKITTKGGQLLSTHRPIIEAICDGLEAAGLPRSHILIWDKNASDMRAAGFTPSPATDSHAGITSVFPDTGYDPDVTYKNDMIGRLIWGDSEFVSGNDDLLRAVRDAVHDKPYDDGSGGVPSTGGLGDDDAPQTSVNSHYARLLTTTCTKIINVPVLVDNPDIGMEGCLGSLALASIDNNRRFLGDPIFGDPAIGEILNRDFIRHKVILNILDALVAQYAGGPRFDPQFTRAAGAIYVSRDPVAIDSLVLKRLERWRATDTTGRLDPIGKAANHIHDAALLKLGTDDPARIQLVKLP